MATGNKRQSRQGMMVLLRQKGSQRNESRKKMNSERTPKGSRRGELRRARGKAGCQWSIWSQQEPGEAEKKVQITLLSPGTEQEGDRLGKAFFSLLLVPPYQAEEWQCVPSASQLWGSPPSPTSVGAGNRTRSQILGTAQTHWGWKEPLSVPAQSCTHEGLDLSRLNLINPTRISSVPTPAAG